MLRAIFSCYRNRTGAAIVGDKTPEYVTQVPLISTLLPEARFVHIVRDPRDYALSIRNAWRKSALRAVQRWKSQIRKYRQDVELSSVRQLTVRYEDLIKDPQAVLSGVCDLLDVRFQASMTSLDEPSEDLGDARELRTVLASNMQKWIDGLSNEELRRIESIAGDLMCQLGYQTAGEPGDQDLAWMNRLRLQAADGVNLFRFRRRTEGGVAAALASHGAHTGTRAPMSNGEVGAERMSVLGNSSNGLQPFIAKVTSPTSSFLRLREVDQPGSPSCSRLKADSRSSTSRSIFANRRCKTTCGSRIGKASSDPNAGRSYVRICGRSSTVPTRIFASGGRNPLRDFGICARTEYLQDAVRR